MKVLDLLILATGSTAFLFQMISVRVLFQTFNEQKLTHLCIGLVLLSLVTLKQALEEKKRPLLSIIKWSIPIFLTVALFLYLRANYFDLIQKGEPDFVDMVSGVTLIVLCIGYTKKFFGYPIVTIALAFIAYTLLGYNFTGFLNTGPYEFPYIISKYSVGFDGVLGFILGISVKYVFLFVVFGSLLLATGGTVFSFTLRSKYLVT